MVAKIITVANTKGGCGKTTIALQIALARALKKKDVWFVDGDRQQTATMALALRAAQKNKVSLASASYSDGTLLRSQVLLQQDRWDTIVIDVGGFDSSTMRAALSIADVVIVPFQPRNFDVWGLAPLTKLLQEISDLRGGINAYALMNCAEPNKESVDNKDAQSSLADFPILKLLRTMICRRKAFANSSGFGLSVRELKNKDPKATAEIDALMNEIFEENE